MIKQYITPINIISFFWIAVLFSISQVYPHYYRYSLYISIIIIIPLMIVNLLKKRKEDKLNGTKIFQSSIYRMLIMAAVLLVFFFITKQNHI
jgi:Na+-translocating ferredoxin:NAD+ oxidoreductase RnfE subunit